MKPEPIPMETLIDRAAWLFGMTPAALVSKSRKPRLVSARNAVALAARVSGRSYPEIAPSLNYRCHGSIMHGCTQAEERYRGEESYRAKVDALITLVRRHAANDA